MRRSGVIVVALLFFALLGMLAPPSQAQAPAPAVKVSLGGVLDTATSAHWNTSDSDKDYTRPESFWATRQRFNPVLLAELDKTRLVMAFEVDLNWGMTGAGWGTSTIADGPNFAFQTAGGMGPGVDVLNAIEIKQMYLELPMPLMPWPTLVRLGGQPGFGTTGYKPTVFFDDFPGVYLRTTVTPAVTGHFVYAQFEEDGPGCPRASRRADVPNAARWADLCTGKTLRNSASNVTFSRNAFDRGDDFVLSANVEVTPFKGLDLRPLWIYWSNKGQYFTSQATNVDALFGAGGVNLSTAFGSDQARREYHYLGLDARWRSGPWGLDPTFIWLLGHNDLASNAVGAFKTGGIVRQNVDSWLLDVRGDYRTGPFLLGGFLIWTPGNSADDNLGQAVDERGVAARTVFRKPTTQSYFRPVLTGGGYGAGTTNFFGGGEIDYLRGMVASSIGRGTTVSFDRYGLFAFGLKPSYALTRALTLKGMVAANFTDEQVDTHGTWSLASGLTPESGEPRAGKRGDSNYLGTELAAGISWALAPGVTFDTGGAYLFSGDALDQCKEALVVGVCTFGRASAKDAQRIDARVRFSF